MKKNYRASACHSKKISRNTGGREWPGKKNSSTLRIDPSTPPPPPPPHKKKYQMVRPLSNLKIKMERVI